jgi:predicted dehydrogenase
MSAQRRAFRVTRRSFLKTTTAFAASAGLPLWFVEETLDAATPVLKPGPNEKPNVALVGCGGMGRHDARLASAFGNIVAVCDVDTKRGEEASKQFAGAKTYKDFRQLLERDDIHVLINGTPDHWHTLINLAAMKAGKDVYSEKPLTLTIDEGKRVVATAEKTKRILQTGSQQRSDAKFRLACELVRNGRLGRLRHITVVLPAGLRDGPFRTAPIPTELDWNFWQGQTPSVDYVPQRCHGSFRYWYEYSGGTMTDWGAHHNDIALWGLGLESSGPVNVEGEPLIDMIPDGYTAPQQYRVKYTYANDVTHTCMSTMRNRFDGSVAPDATKDLPEHGVKFEGSDGWISVTRGKLEASRPELLSEPLVNKKVSLYVSDNHMKNFFDCVRSRQQPICEAEIGHRSVSVCHLGVIAIRLGRTLKWNPDREVFVDDKEANKWLAREQRSPFSYDFV